MLTRVLQSLELIARVRHLFAGVHRGLLVFVAECSLQLNVLYLLLRHRLDSSVERTVPALLREEIERAKW